MKEKFISTRGGQRNVTASESIIKGLAADGGLFVPSFIHDCHLDIECMIDLSYGEMAKKVFSLFLDDFSEEQIENCIHNAYYTGRFENEEPVSVVHAGDRWYLELFHGPTCAFKDIALTILPHFMTTSMQNVKADKDIVILTATSGDTGKAALAGFADVPHIGIIVFYPKDGVSTIQEKQMITQEGDNTCVIGVKGNFDDTQNGVKAIFGNTDFEKQIGDKGFVLSSANSINIGRLLPQITYYFYSYAQLVKEGAVEVGHPINFVVPTGNFGDILAGYYARLLGLPVNRLICASNSNKVLTDFFATGEYDRNRPFYKTMSPSMDILISSNLERLLYDLTDGDTEMIRALMNDLSADGKYSISEEIISDAKTLFTGGFSDETQTAAEIKGVFENCHYLIDPHTAVAGHVYTEYKTATGDDTPTVVLSTASPYKFGHSVYESIFGAIPEGLNDFEVLNALAEKTGTTVPAPLKDLDKKADRHQQVSEKADMLQCVRDFILK